MKSIVVGVMSAAYLLANIAPALANAPIAEASGLQGKVLVNHGKGFVPAARLVLLNDGDKIMVGANSSAKINYLNSKCSISANASSVVTVTTAAPCKAGVVVGSADTVFAVPASNIGADPSFVPPPDFPILPVILIGGAAVVAGGYILLSNRCNGVSVC